MMSKCWSAMCWIVPALRLLITVIGSRGLRKTPHVKNVFVGFVRGTGTSGVRMSVNNAAFAVNITAAVLAQTAVNGVLYAPVVVTVAVNNLTNALSLTAMTIPWNMSID